MNEECVFSEVEFVEYIIGHLHKTFCSVCNGWHDSFDTFLPCCYDNSSSFDKLCHYEEIAKKLLNSKQ